MRIESIPAAHPELADLGWVWDNTMWDWVLVGGSPYKIHAEAGANIDGKWAWFGPRLKPSNVYVHGQCETFADARSCAEQAVADWLKGNQ